MRLSHLHLASLTPYAHASHLQSLLVHGLLQHKSHPDLVSAPNPTILTAEFFPVYTCGRREINKLSARQRAHLLADGRAEFFEAQRGGQTTFHGPGQLVAYPVVDLRRHAVSPREYVRVLEEAVAGALKRFGINGFRTENPGVWVSEKKKIAAVGVRLRKHVTSHGVGINVNTDLTWFERIVACGLEGMETTSFEREGVSGKTVAEVGRVFVEEFAGRIGGVSEIGRIGVEDVMQTAGNQTNFDTIKGGNHPVDVES